MPLLIFEGGFFFIVLPAAGDFLDIIRIPDVSRHSHIDLGTVGYALPAKDRDGLKAVFLCHHIEEFWVVLIRCAIQSLCEYIVPGISLNLIGILHILVAPVLVVCEKEQVADLVSGGFKVIAIREAVLVIFKFVREDVLDVIRVTPAFAGNVLLEMGRITHQNINV